MIYKRVSPRRRGEKSGVTGTPEEIVKEKRNYTRQYLKPVPAKKDAVPRKKGQKATE